MRLLVKRPDQTVKKFQFGGGDIYIGRHRANQICLPEKAVSRKHALISNTEDGKWVVKDLDSANKTYLNDKPIHQAEVKSGDRLRIAEFTLEINLEDDSEEQPHTPGEETFQLEASLTTPMHDIIVRRPDAQHAPAMRLAAKRLTDFSQATEFICKADGLDAMLQTLLNITLKQFTAFRTWCALRDQPSGPMTYHAGKRRDGKAVQLEDIKLHDKINLAIEKGQSLVLPRVSAQMEENERIRSAMIAPIMRPSGCYGVLYVDNAMVHEHYSLSDLDYLMFLAMHTAAVLRNF